MKISVIVPVYNTEKYLKKCIESVKNQTYSNWEMIMVNDGSTDASADICSKAAEEDRRIKVFSQENRGPGVSRNFGISKASGDYIVFLDSDDYIESDYFELLVPSARKNDVVFIDVNQVSCDGEILKKEKTSTYKNEGKDRIIRAQMTGKLPWGGVRKAVRTDIIKTNNILYDNFSVGEEALYSFRILSVANSIGFLDKKAVYSYVNRSGSQSKTEDTDPWGKVFAVLKDYIQKNNMYELYSSTLNSFNVTATIVSLNQIYKSGAKNADNLAKKRLEIFKETFDAKSTIDSVSLDKRALLLYPFIKCGFLLPVKICSIIKNKI